MTIAAQSDRPAWRPGRLIWVALALALSLTLNVFFVGGLMWSRLTPHVTPAQRLMHLGQELDLQGDQSAAFQKFIHTVREHGRQLHQSNGPLLQQIWAELAKPAPDPAVVAHLADNANQNRQLFQKETASALMTFLTTLSPQQRSHFAELARGRQDEAAFRLWQMLLR